MKYIMWFSDGTGNDPETRTNVYWLYKLVEKVKTDTGRSDIVISHDSGVGTLLRRHKLTKKIPGIIGLGGGAGFAKNIRDGYRFLVAQYHETSKVYLFGFSRGAYTSRSLANFIYFCGGLIQKPIHPFYKWMVIHYLFNLYRWRNFIPHATLSALLTKAKTDFAIIKCPIEVIGVWDTVGSVGLPSSWNWFHLDDITPDTKWAFHALALDERRKFYNPIKFVKNHKKPINESSNNQIIKEVWFAGVHSDIGGGYKEDYKELPHVSLKWMLSQMPPDFPVKESEIRTDNCLGKMHKSDYWYWLLLGNRKLSKDDVLHESVLERMSKSDYVPKAEIFGKVGTYFEAD